MNLIDPADRCGTIRYTPARPRPGREGVDGHAALSKESNVGFVGVVEHGYIEDNAFHHELNLVFDDRAPFWHGWKG